MPSRRCVHAAVIWDLLERGRKSELAFFFLFIHYLVPYDVCCWIHLEGYYLRVCCKSFCPSGEMDSSDQPIPSVFGPAAHPNRQAHRPTNLKFCQCQSTSLHRFLLLHTHSPNRLPLIEAHFGSRKQEAVCLLC